MPTLQVSVTSYSVNVNASFRCQNDLRGRNNTNSSKPEMAASCTINYLRVELQNPFESSYKFNFLNAFNSAEPFLKIYDISMYIGVFVWNVKT